MLWLGIILLILEKMIKKLTMKKLIALAAIGFLSACNEPINVTGKSDPQATTGGTMGSVKANNQMPALDTPATRNRPDTMRRH